MRKAIAEIFAAIYELASTFRTGVQAVNHLVVLGEEEAKTILDETRAERQRKLALLTEEK